MWANNESESGLWLAASDGSEAKRISATTSSFAVGSGPIWFNSHELAYVECDENFSNCSNRLYDLNSDIAMVIDLPPETIVVLGPFNSQPSE